MEIPDSRLLILLPANNLLPTGQTSLYALPFDLPVLLVTDSDRIKSHFRLVLLEQIDMK